MATLTTTLKAVTNCSCSLVNTDVFDDIPTVRSIKVQEHARVASDYSTNQV
jgi:hypothetical protein